MRAADVSVAGVSSRPPTCGKRRAVGFRATALLRVSGHHRAEVSAYIDAHAEESMRMVTGWWSATVITTNAR